MAYSVTNNIPNSVLTTWNASTREIYVGSLDGYEFNNDCTVNGTATAPISGNRLVRTLPSGTSGNFVFNGTTKTAPYSCNIKFNGTSYNNVSDSVYGDVRLIYDVVNGVPTITLSCIGAKRFVSAPNIRYSKKITPPDDKNNFVNANDVFTLSYDKKTAVFADVNLLSYWRVTIENTTTEIGFYEVVNNVVGKENLNEFLANYGGASRPNSITLILRGTQTNYKFTTIPTATYTDTNNTVKTVQFTNIVETETAQSATIAITDFDYTKTLTVNGVYEYSAPIEKTVQVTRNLANCTTNAPQSISENDTEINIICTANNGFTFESAPTIMFYDANDVVLHGFTFDVLPSKLSANVTFDVSQFDDFADVETIVLTAAAAHVPQTIELTTTATNCTTNAPQYVNETDTQITITATANANCEFDTAPILTIRLKNSSYRSVVFTIAQNKLTAVGTLNVSQIGFANIDTLTLNATAEIVTPQFEKYGTINVYKVTTNNLADFAAQRFITYGSGDTANVLDLGNYVNSIKRLYINVGECVNNVLKCGNHNTNIAVQTPLNDVITVNCGAVAIPTPNNSNTDYNSEITLFLPFIGLVVISSEFVGKTLNLAYKCNIIKGDAIAEITVNDVIMLQYECNVSYDVIYKTLQTQTAFNTVGNVDFNTQILKGLQPYVVLKYYTDKNAQIINADCLRVPLSEVSGYFAAKEIENFVSDTITETETEILYNEIANGVFILAV